MDIFETKLIPFVNDNIESDYIEYKTGIRIMRATNRVTFYL